MVEIEPEAVQLRGSFERPRGPSTVVALILAAVLLAIVKPWSAGEPGPSAGPSSAGLAASGGIAAPPQPTPVQRVDPNGMQCLAGDVEQVVAIDRFARDEVRNWIAVLDVPADGPLDPRLVPITIHSSHVVGLGICGRWTGDGSEIAGRILAVHLVLKTPAGPTATNLGAPAPITLALGGLDAAVLYGPPSGSIASQRPPPASARSTGASTGPAAWPAGDYVLAFRYSSDGADTVRWIAIHLLPSADASR